MLRPSFPRPAPPTLDTCPDLPSAARLRAIALLGVGDGVLSPALNRLAAGGEDTNARRLAYTGLGITALAIGLMTRVIYARS